MKKLGGEVRAKRLRKRLALSPARCALAASSFASLLLAVVVYVAAIPGFTPPSTYKLPQTGENRGSSFVAADIVKGFAGSQRASDQQNDGATAEAASEMEPSGLAASLAGVARSTVQQAEQSSSSAASGREGDVASNAGSGSSSLQEGEGANSSTANNSSAASGPDSNSNAGSDSSGANNASSSLSAAEEAEFHSFLVARFNDLVNMPANQNELAGRLEVCVNTGYYGDASANYSSTMSCDGAIDSVKASLNRQVAVAEKSRYYRAWEELELCCNDSGSASVALIQGWRLASSSNPAASSSQMLSYASQARSSANGAYSHLDSARGLL